MKAHRLYRSRGSRARTLRGAALLLALVFFLAGCKRDTVETVAGEPPPNLSDFNVVIILIDTLRADHLGAYGYSKPTSPVIDVLAANGVVFEQAHAPSSFTRESIAALFTGRLPSQSGATGWDARPRGQAMGARFRDAGFQTGFFGESSVVDHPDYHSGFNEVEIFPLSNADREHAPKLSERALRFASENAGSRFMMYVHYLDPHGEYYPPAAYAKRFVEQAPSVPLTLYETREGVINVRQHRNALLAKGFAPGQKDFEDWVGAYDAEVAYVDDAVRLLVDGLRDLGVLDRTLIVLTSDHGEEFFEHGYVEHAWTVYQESTHVPLIFHAPAVLPAARFGDAVSTVRVLPTLLELLGMPASTSEALPTPLFRRDARGVTPVLDAGPVISENHIEFRNSSIAIREGGWKYVAWMRWIPPQDRRAALNVDDLRPDSASSRPLDAPILRDELYNVTEDPDEQVDLAREHPDVLERMRSLLDVYRQQRSAPAAQPVDQEGDAGQEALESLGYL